MTVELIHGEHLAGALETEMTGRTEIRDVSTKAGECTDRKGQDGEKAESIWRKITGFLNASLGAHNFWSRQWGTMGENHGRP